MPLSEAAAAADIEIADVTEAKEVSAADKAALDAAKAKYDESQGVVGTETSEAVDALDVLIAEAEAKKAELLGA